MQKLLLHVRLLLLLALESRLLDCNLCSKAVQLYRNVTSLSLTRRCVFATMTASRMLLQISPLYVLFPAVCS